MANPKRGDYIIPAEDSYAELMFEQFETYYPVQIIGTNKRRNVRRYSFYLLAKEINKKFKITIDKKDLLREYIIMNKQTANILYGENK